MAWRWPSRPQLRLPRCFSLVYVRVGIQVFTATFLILAATSAHPVWTAVSLDDVVAIPAMALLLCYLCLLFSVGTGLAALQVSCELLAGATAGAGIGIGLTYAVLAINGGSRDNTPTKFVATFFLSGLVAFFGTVLRFRFTKNNMLWMLMLVGMALTIAAEYHSRAALWKFGVHFMYFAVMAAASLLLTMSTVLPQYAGNTIRASICAGLLSFGKVVESGIGTMSDEINDDTGLLKACSGRTEAMVGIDEGLWQSSLSDLHTDVFATGGSISNVWKWEAAARLEWDLYRRQHVFPSRAYGVLTLTLRSMLSSFMMIIYPLQTGRMDCRLTRQHARLLRALAASMAGCCNELADVLSGQLSLKEALPVLKAMEAAYAELVGEVGASLQDAHAPPSSRAVHFNMILATLFTLCTRIRQLFMTAPEALGRDDPAATAALAAHLLAVDRGGSRTWHFPTLMQRVRRAQPAPRPPLALLHDSLRAGDEGPRGPPGPSLKQYLAAQGTPAPKVLPVRESAPRATQRALDWLRGRTGVTPNHLIVGLQGALGYCIILVMVMVPAVNDAFEGRMLWGMLIVITILEPMTGSVIIKGFQRLLGTVLGAVLGLGVLYFTYLCNGLTYVSHPQKYIVMTISLPLVTGVLGGCAIRFSSYFYCFLIAAIITALVALPNYHVDETYPQAAIWRLASTAVGVVVNVILVAVCFPISARSVHQTLMLSALEGLADVMDRACHCLVPREHRRKAGRGAVRRATDSLGRARSGGVRAASRLLRAAEALVAGGREGGEGQVVDVEPGAEAREGSAEKAPDEPSGDRASAQPGAAGLADRVAGSEPRAGPGATADLSATDSPAPEPSPSPPEGPSPQHARPCTRVDTAPGVGTERGGRPSLLITYSPPPAHARGVLMAQGPGLESIYLQVGEAGVRKVVGAAYLAVLPQLKAIAMLIGAMGALEPALHYEYYPFSKVKRFPFVAAKRAQRLCRHLLNVAGSFSAALDAHDTYSCPPLIPVAGELEDVGQQLQACLLALAGVLKRTVAVERAVDMVVNLEDLVRHLFLTVLAQGGAAEESSTDAILGVTFLAMLFNATYVVRLLCVALVQAFSPEDVEALAHASMLSDSTRWAVDEQLMVLCSDMMAAALYPDSGEEGVAELVQDASRSASGWEAELAAFSRRSMQPD
ncbi:hypothetical protein ACKKBF_B32780 [Auxenochlorella protothecoides x Auxenochlorella symbiontica]